MPPEPKPWLFRPPAPDWLSEVAFITGWFLQGCSAPWQLIVEFSKAPLWDVVCVFGAFDLEDVMRGFFKPEGLRSKRHGRKGTRDGKKGAGGIGIPDINEVVAQRLSGGNPIRGRPFGNLTTYLFTIADELDRAQFTCMILGLAPDAIFKTMYGMLQANKDLCPQMARVNRAMGYDYIIHSDGFTSTTLANLNFNVGCTSTNFGVAMPTVMRTYIATWEMEFTNPFPGEAEVQIAIYRQGTQDYVASSYPATIGTGETIRLQCDALCSTDLGFQWHARASQSVESHYKQFTAFSITK